MTDSENENVSLLEPQIGAEKGTYITTLASAGTADEVVSFRTVPGWLKANGQKIRVNAVLDDASSTSYVSEEVAGPLEYRYHMNLLQFKC